MQAAKREIDGTAVGEGGGGREGLREKDEVVEEEEDEKEERRVAEGDQGVQVHDVTVHSSRDRR
jgi:hypothetical protein